MWRNTIAIYSVLKKKKYKAKFSTSSILKKKTNKNNYETKIQKIKKKDNFGKNKKNEKKNMWGKLKLDYQPVQYKKNLPKIILEKKHWGKYRSKTKIMWGNIVTTHNVFLKKNYETK